MKGWFERRSTSCEKRASADLDDKCFPQSKCRKAASQFEGLINSAMSLRVRCGGRSNPSLTKGDDRGIQRDRHVVLLAKDSSR